MALTTFDAQMALQHAKDRLRHNQRELYYCRTAKQPSTALIKAREKTVLFCLTTVFNLQQAVKRLAREDQQRIDHWRAFI